MRVYTITTDKGRRAEIIAPNIYTAFDMLDLPDGESVTLIKAEKKRGAR